MKRPLATIGFTYLLALAAAVSFGFTFSVITAVFLAVVTLIAFSSKSLRRGVCIPVALLTSCVAFSVFSLYTYFCVLPVNALYNCEAYIYGVVEEEPYTQYDNHYVVLDVDSVSIEGAAQNFRMRVSVSDIDEIEVTDRISAKVHFLEIPEKSKDYRISKGILLYGYQVKETTLRIDKTKSHPVKRTIFRFRKNLIASIDEILPGSQADLLIAVLTGDTIGLDENIKSDFRRTGVSHLLAVSGLHTSIICFAVYSFLRFLKIPKNASSIASCFAVLFFMALTGFVPSVARSGVMAIILMLGRMFRREADSINSMGFSCILICLPNPYAAADIGLQLSLTATLGMILLTPRVNRFFLQYIQKIKEKRIKMILSPIAASFAQTIGATVLTIPLTLVYFREISIVSPIANLLVIELFSLFLMVGGIAALFQMTGFLSILGKPFALAAFLTGKLINFIINFLANLENASVLLPFSYITIWVCATLLLFAIALFLKKNISLFKIASILSLILFLAGTASYQILNVGVTTIHVQDISGNAVLFSKGNRGFLIGCGGDSFDVNTINESMENTAVSSLHAVILNDLEKQGAGNAVNIIRKYNPDYIFMPYDGTYREEIKYYADNASLYQLENSQISPWKDAVISVYTDTAGINWIFVKIDGFTSLFCPQGGNVKLLPEEKRQVDLAFVSGAEITNMSLLECSMVVIQQDTKNAARTKQFLQLQGKENIYTTFEEGNFMIKTRGGRYISVRGD